MKSTLLLIGCLFYSSFVICNSESNFQCNSQDLVFAIDESGSINSGLERYPIELNFTKQLILMIDPDSNVGILTFDGSATVHHELSESQNRNDLMAVVDGLPYGGGSTNYEDAMNDGIPLFASGDASFPDIFVFVTDGFPNSPDSDPCDAPINYKDELDDADVTAIIVGVGSGFNPASPSVTCLVDDTATQIVWIQEFTQEAIDEQVDFVANIICGVCTFYDIEVCSNEPCSCNEVTNCNTCTSGNGCTECADGYFQPSLEYDTQCSQCQETFGDECLLCEDYKGCTKCDSGYELVYSDQCGLYGCESETCGDACPNGAYDSSLDIDENGCPILCNNSPCSCDELCFCQDDTCHENGCNQCQDGYFKKDYNYPCISCTEIYESKCLFCQDFDGCGQCAAGYERVYNAECGLFECE